MAKPRALDTIVYGGLTVGVLDGVDATVFFGALGIPATRIAKHVASGALGPEAFAGGAGTIAFGVAMHFCVAIAIATTFWLLATQVRVLVARPVISGLAFGAAAYFVMGHVVLPLSRARTGGFAWPSFVNGVVGHAVLIGLPIALWAARSMRGPREVEGGAVGELISARR